MILFWIHLRFFNCNAHLGPLKRLSRHILADTRCFKVFMQRYRPYLLRYSMVHLTDPRWAFIGDQAGMHKV